MDLELFQVTINIVINGANFAGIFGQLLFFPSQAVGCAPHKKMKKVENQ